MRTIIVAETNKGRRLWLEDTCNHYGWPVGARYHTTYEAGRVVYQLAPEGKRKVAKGKGGVIDTVGKTVTLSMVGFERAAVLVDRPTGRITIVGVK